jgi:hypothetical protein
VALVAVVAGLAVAVPAAWANLAQVAVKTQPNPIREITPAISGSYFAWAQSSKVHPNTYNVYAQAATGGVPGGTPVRVNISGSTGFLGGIAGTRLAYEQIVGGQSDVRFFNLALHVHSNPPPGVNSPAYEFDPSITASWLMFGRDTASSVNILLFNLTTHSIRVLASFPHNSSHTAFGGPGQVNGNYAAYWTCRPYPTSRNVYRYDIAARTTTKITRVSGDLDTTPAVTATGTLYWDRATGQNCHNVRLMQLPLGGSQTVLNTFSNGNDISFLQVWNDGTHDQVFYTRYTPCSTNAADIYKVVAP